MTQEKFAFVFPGQGSQKVGMLHELAAVYPIVSQTFGEASEVLRYDLWDLAQNGTQEDINLTERTQPMLLAASVAVWRIWQEQKGAQPSLMAGHSLGEWSALVCAGVVDFAAAIKLVQQRGKFMQEAVPAGQGAMAAVIGLDDAAIIEACKNAEQGDIVSAVNFNSPGQVVIAGAATAVERAGVLCKAAGAKRILPLPVSAPFHTALMLPAANQLAEQISVTQFNSPLVPVVHNVTAQIESDAEKIKALMIEQIYSAVRWVECIKTISHNGVKTIVECGPGKVLSGLNKRIDPELTSFSLEKPEDLKHVLENF